MCVRVRVCVIAETFSGVFHTFIVGCVYLGVVFFVFGCVCV